MNQEENTELPKTDSIEAEDILAMVDGIPLPPAVKKNLWKSLGRLVTGLVDIPVAYLESKSESIKGETVALNLFRNRVAEKASTEFTNDNTLMNRAVNYYGSKLLKEQINRESVIDKTSEELKLNPPKEDADNEIDEDWLEMFSRITETKSKEEIQLILSKILAGEVKKPGSFGYKTLQILTNLDQQTGKLFQNLCAISYELIAVPDDSVMIIHTPFGNPGNNSLKDYGLNYKSILEIQDAGLLQHSITTTVKITKKFFTLPFKIGDKTFLLNENESSSEKDVQITIMKLTKAGTELRKVMNFGSIEIFNSKLINWAKNNFKLVE